MLAFVESLLTHIKAIGIISTWKAEKNYQFFFWGILNGEKMCRIATEGEYYHACLKEVESKNDLQWNN